MHKMHILSDSLLCNVNKPLDDWMLDKGHNWLLMKWLRYQRVISLKIQVGNTNQRNKWANRDPRLYRRWDQVPRWSKHPQLIDHTRREPSSMITWMRSYPLSKSLCQVQSYYWYEKCQTTYGSMKVSNYKLDHCNGQKTCETLPSNETVEIPVTSTCLSVVCFDWKSNRM
jgi:hypothetical protein